MAWVRNTPEGTPTEGPKITWTITAFVSLSFVLLSLRIYVRVFLIKAAGYDDLAITVSWLGAFGYTMCTIFHTTWGLGLKNLDDMPMENLYDFGLLQYIGGPFYVIGIYSFKLSLLLSYLRFLPGGYRIATIILAVIITMAHIAFINVFLFLCTPIAKQWDPKITWGHCVEAVPFYMAFSALTIVFDVSVLILPFPALLGSQIQRRKKVVLLGLFGLGIFVTITQILRIRTIQNLSNYLDSSGPILWSLVEANIGVIITCIPTLAPMVKYFAEKTRKGTSVGSNNKLDSRYALQTWRSGKNGMRPLGSRADHETEIRANQRPTSDSTDNILIPVGIRMKTDVTVTRQKVSSSNDFSSVEG